MQHRHFIHHDTVGFFARGEIPGVLCFVPFAAMKDGELQRGIYAQMKYNTFNTQINPSAVGSHTFPDSKRINEVIASKEVDTFVALLSGYDQLIFNNI